MLKRSAVTYILLALGIPVLLCGCPSEPGQNQAGGTRQGSAQPAPAEDGPAPVPAPVVVDYPEGQWWGDGCDPHNQGYTASTGPKSAESVESVEFGDLSGRLGLLPDGTVIVGVYTGIRALKPDGKVAWQAEGTGNKVDFAISLEPSPRIYLRSNTVIQEHVTILGKEPWSYGRQASVLVAVAPDGKELWQADLEGAMLGMPCVEPEGGVLGLQFVSKAEFHDKGHVERLSNYAEMAKVTHDGVLEWHKILPRLRNVINPPEPSCMVLLRNGNVGFMWVDQTFHVFNAESFREWDYSVLSVPDCLPAVSPNTKVTQLANDRPTLTEKQLKYMNKEAMNLYGVLHSIKSGGTKHWDLQVGSDAHTQVAIGADGGIFFGTNVFHDDRDGEWSTGQIVALNEKGQLQYNYEMHDDALDYPLGAPPLVDGSGTLYITDSGGNLYAIDAAGQLKWETAIDGQFLTNPVIADGVLYIGADDGKVYMIGGE